MRPPRYSVWKRKGRIPTEYPAVHYTPPDYGSPSLRRSRDIYIIVQVEINNFRESFERGEDPLADMTDASDINSVCGVLKLYLRNRTVKPSHVLLAVYITFKFDITLKNVI